MRAPPIPDCLLALACVLALIGSASVGTDGRAFTPLAIPLAIVAVAPLAWRRLAPIGVLLATGAGLLIFVAAVGPGDAASVIAMIPLYTVAVLGDRRRSLIVGIGSALVLGAAISALAPNEFFGSGAIRLLVILSALIVGDTVRSRRALRVANAERDEQMAREREMEGRRRIADERVRIARELHDSLGHSLVAINVRAGVSQHIGDPGASSDALGEIKDVSANALRDLRSTLDVLRDRGETAPTRPSEGLADLPDLLESVRAGGVQAESEVEIAGSPIPTTLGQAAFRIVQESLTNVLRHADASRARVAVRVIAGNLDIEVTDDGRASAAAAPGHGLRGMTERAGALGGSIEAGPVAEGWRVHARLPLGGSAAT
ncbi:MAG TPA: histidine kinase [Solirubrobacterales bacterium]|nr:histidine kinase [Solirubrobacterales bacterium]